ncbi:MAG: ABC transporter ATP-binding protein [Hydrogenothermaceae bacterium]
MNNFSVIAKSIKKIYYTDSNTSTVALRGIDLQINKGEMVAIMGPSGSGKSTLLHILGGIDIPTSGEVLIEETDIYKLPDKQLSKFRNENIGFVFQFHYLLSEFTALDNVALPLQIKGDKEATQKAKDILEKVGLGDRLNHKPSMLSGGEQQRVAIARAVVNNPKILIADEPTGNLDSENAKNVINLIKDLSEKNLMTVIIATHDIEIAKYCRYIYYLKDGIIVNVEKN